MCFTFYRETDGFQVLAPLERPSEIIELCLLPVVVPSYISEGNGRPHKGDIESLQPPLNIILGRYLYSINVYFSSKRSFQITFKKH